jgi:putative acetyltransferase
MTISLQAISPIYDQDVKQIIKTVGAEFGAVGEGFGPSDAEVEQMSQFYTPDSGSYYLIAVENDIVIGGAGIAPFNESESICELKKLFLLPQARGKGIGKKLTEQCLNFAKSFGYQQCYLDTLSNMTDAIKLYEAFGFTHLSSPLEGTIHNGCDVWMLKTL